MPLDPQVRAMRDARMHSPSRPLYEMSLAEARTADLAAIMADRGQPLPLGAVVDIRIPGPAGQLPARVYRPVGEPPFPVLMYFYGGGWTLGNLDTGDGICRQLCAATSCLVVSVGYRVAPEHRFPAAPHDCYAATQWVAAHGHGLGADPSRLAVAGDSAGGNLAAAVTLLARERGAPRLTCQLLVYPNTNYRADTPSMRDNTDRCFFNRESVAWYWSNYLARPEDGDDPLASPLRAPDLRGLPPALVITAEYDPLRDEAEQYAQRLREAGVPVVSTRYPGMIHGFFSMSGTLDAARDAIAEAAAYLSAALDPAHPREPLRAS
jgi:acetyl esterase